jgi:hypothetical protein
MVGAVSVVASPICPRLSLFLAGNDAGKEATRYENAGRLQELSFIHTLSPAMIASGALP